MSDSMRNMSSEGSDSERSTQSVSSIADDDVDVVSALVIPDSIMLQYPAEVPINAVPMDIDDSDWEPENGTHHQNLQYWKDACEANHQMLINSMPQMLHFISYETQPVAEPVCFRLLLDLYSKISSAFDSVIGDHVNIPMDVVEEGILAEVKLAEKEQ